MLHAQREHGPRSTNIPTDEYASGHEHLIRIHPTLVQHIYFVDEVFWIKNDWLRQFLKLYNERIGIGAADRGD